MSSIKLNRAAAEFVMDEDNNSNGSSTPSSSGRSTSSGTNSSNSKETLSKRNSTLRATAAEWVPSFDMDFSTPSSLAPTTNAATETTITTATKTTPASASTTPSTSFASAVASASSSSFSSTPPSSSAATSSLSSSANVSQSSTSVNVPKVEGSTEKKVTDEEEAKASTPEPVEEKREVLNIPLGVQQKYTIQQLLYFRDDTTIQAMKLDPTEWKDLLRPKESLTVDNGRGWRDDSNKNQRQNVNQKGGYRNNNGRGLMEPEVKALVKTENRYVVKQISEGDEKKLRDMRSILNKLCPEKFDPLVEKAMALQIDNVDLLEKCVESVMEKALAEPKFSPTYAQFCVKLQTISLSAIAEDGTGAAPSYSFKKVLLNLCQREFDKQANNEEGKAKQANVEEMTEEQISEMDMAKKRMLGAIRFIGELFVRNMLRAAIITDECVSKLIESPSEEDMEALCKLLSTVGFQLDLVGNTKPTTKPDGKKTLDGTKIKEKMADIYDKLEKMAQVGSGLSSRIRFMIQNLLECRAANWKKKGEDNEAKKLADVKVASPPTPQSKTSTPVAANARKGSNRYSSSSTAASASASASSSSSQSGGVKARAAVDSGDGWETTVAPNRRNNKFQNMRGGRGGAHDNSRNGGRDGVSGGRPDAYKPPGQVQRGAAASLGKGKQANSSETKPLKAVNVYGGLMDDEEEDNEEEDGEEVGEEDAEEGEGKRDDDSKEDADVAVDAAAASSHFRTRTDLSISVGDAPDVIDKIMVEYFAGGDMNEVVSRMNEDLGNDAVFYMVLVRGWAKALEGKDAQRQALTQLLPFLVQHRMLNKADVVKGYREAFDSAAMDWMADCPRALEFMVPSLAGFTKAGIFAVEAFFGDLTAPLSDAGSLSHVLTFFATLIKAFVTTAEMEKDAVAAKLKACNAIETVAQLTGMSTADVESKFQSAGAL